MPILALLLFLSSGVVAFVGLLSLSEATLGVGFIAFACYLGIVARLAQASGHLDVLKTALTRRPVAVATAPSEPEPIPSTAPDNSVKYIVLALIGFVAVSLIGILIQRSFFG